jgi:hypothetical protein
VKAISQFVAERAMKDFVNARQGDLHGPQMAVAKCKAAYATSYSHAFPYRRPLGFASVIVVWPHAKGIEIHCLPRRNSTLSATSQAIFCGVIQSSPTLYWIRTMSGLSAASISDTASQILSRWLMAPA